MEWLPVWWVGRLVAAVIPLIDPCFFALHFKRILRINQSIRLILYLTLPIPTEILANHHDYDKMADSMETRLFINNEVWYSFAIKQNS